MERLAKVLSKQVMQGDVQRRQCRRQRPDGRCRRRQQAVKIQEMDGFRPLDPVQCLADFGLGPAQVWRQRHFAVAHQTRVVKFKADGRRRGTAANGQGKRFPEFQGERMDGELHDEAPWYGRNWRSRRSTETDGETLTLDADSWIT